MLVIEQYLILMDFFLLKIYIYNNKIINFTVTVMYVETDTCIMYFYTFICFNKIN